MIGFVGWFKITWDSCIDLEVLAADGNTPSLKSMEINISSTRVFGAVEKIAPKLMSTNKFTWKNGGRKESFLQLW